MRSIAAAMFKMNQKRRGPKPGMQKKILAVSVTPEEMAMATEDARREGFTRSVYIGQLIRAGHRAIEERDRKGRA